MRKLAAAVLGFGLIAAAAPAGAQQSLLGNTGPATQDLGPPVAVAPAPPIAPAAPDAPAPQVIAPPAPPGLVQTPVPPDNADSGSPPPDGTAPDNSAPSPAPAGLPPAAAAPGAAAAPAVIATAPAAVPSTADSTPPPFTNDWVPQKTAALGVLDKVDGSTAAITIPVGGQATIGDLLVDVLACESRPAGEIPDDVIFVSIQPEVQSDGGPIFRGWMLRSLPGATVVGDASETFRVTGCQ